MKLIPGEIYQPSLLNPRGHENCLHWGYALSCHTFEVLLERSKGVCEICGLAGFQNARRKLFIDHDPTVGQWAVRGLLCFECNTYLEKLREPEVDRFKANAFYLQILKDCGAPLYLEEPPRGARVVDVQGLPWERRGDEWHHAPERWQRPKDRIPQRWERLHYKNGPAYLMARLTLPKSAERVAADLVLGLDPETAASVGRILAGER